MPYLISKGYDVSERYNDVFAELHRRGGHCRIIKNGIEELRQRVGYITIIKKDTLKTLSSQTVSVLNLSFGLNGLAYCDCQITKMLNLTPYEIFTLRIRGIRQLQIPARRKLNEQP